MNCNIRETIYKNPNKKRKNVNNWIVHRGQVEIKEIEVKLRKYEDFLFRYWARNFHDVILDEGEAWINNWHIESESKFIIVLKETNLCSLVFQNYYKHEKFSLIMLLTTSW